MHLSTLERKILNCIQEDISLCPQPFKISSRRLGMEEEEFLQRIKRLKDKGIIRNFAASINHKKVGFESSLIALKVPENKIASIVQKLIKYPEVTHCYLRQGEFNLWVVFLYLKKTRFEQFLDKLARKIGKKNILNLPTQRQFKLKTKLKI